MQMSINVSQNRHGKKFTHLREPGQTFLSPAFCGNPRKAASTSSEKSADWEANEIVLALSDSLLCAPSSSYMCFSHKRCDLIFSLIACVLHHSELLTEGTGPDCSRMPSSKGILGIRLERAGGGTGKALGAEFWSLPRP